VRWAKLERVKFAVNAQDGVEIAYSVVGDGAPLVLLHGSLLSRSVWRALGYVDALCDGNKLILVDARGHGDSDKPTTMHAYAMERLVGDVVAVLDDCGLVQTAYLGYSLGGRVAYGLAIQAPERVRALILGGASHRPQTGAPDRIYFPGVIDMIEMEGIEAALERWSDRVGRALDPAVRQVLLGNDPRALVAYLRQMDRDPGFDESALSRVHLPVLLFAGERDYERLSDSRAAASILPNAELFTIADSDHESALAQVDVVVPRVRAFFNRAGRSRGESF
jgi:pimeloyl-ACP methyl ester carboxylesterase